MPDKIAYGAQPVAGPFTVVTEYSNDGGTTWQQSVQTADQEDVAVSYWETAKRYVNTRPVSITPEPNWARYSYDGRTPLTK